MIEVLKAPEVTPGTTTGSRKADTSAGPFVVIEARNLIRQCLTRCLGVLNTPNPVLSFATLSEWRDTANRYPAPSLIVICVDGRMRPKGELARDVALASDANPSTPVVIFVDEENVRQIFEALDAGAKGVVPASLSLDVANQVLQLVKAGGSFVPASALSAPREMADAGSSKRVDGGTLTERQTAVVKKLAQGKPNKIIAYELAMRESTVKVHVRNIMAKLQARNRTQVACIYQSMQPPPSAGEAGRS